jgi:hypothetical protein
MCSARESSAKLQGSVPYSQDPASVACRSAAVKLFLDPSFGTGVTDDLPFVSKTSPYFKQILDELKKQGAQITSQEPRIASLQTSNTSLQTQITSLQFSLKEVRDIALPPAYAIARNICCLMYWGMLDTASDKENGLGYFRGLGKDPQAWSIIFVMTPSQRCHAYHQYRLFKNKHELYRSGHGFPASARDHMKFNQPQTSYTWLTATELTDIDNYFKDPIVGVS